MDIKDKTIDELKVLAYDMLAVLNLRQNELQMVNQEIVNKTRASMKKVEEKVEKKKK